MNPEARKLSMRTMLLTAVFLASTCWAAEPRWVIGSRNHDLAKGARALLAGQNEDGIRLTLLGLEEASGKDEEEIALSNLCAGYTNLGDYETALKYCDLALHRNDRLWRVYTSKALIYIYTKQYDQAELELTKGEALNPGARSLKIARAVYLDATNPVRPEIEVDDRQRDQQ
jgi:tetratricopeptide (TPR) repeat protein